MAFITNDEEAILIVQPVREMGGAIKMKQLKRFKNPKALARKVDQKSWDALAAKIEEKYPHFRIDWDDLQWQARTMVEGPLNHETDLEKAAVQFRQDLTNLNDQLGRLRRDEEFAWKVLRTAGDELQRLFSTVAVMVEGFRHPEEDRFDLWKHTQLWQQLLADSEASFEQVERARYQFRTGSRKKALQTLQTARRLDPFDPDIENSEGVLLREAGRLKEAEAQYSEAAELARLQLPLEEAPWCWGHIEVRPFIRAQSNLALVYRDTGRIQEAVRLLLGCQLFCPDNPLYCDLELAGCYLELDRPRKALEWLQISKGRMMAIPDPHFTSASIHVMLGETEEAVEEMLLGMLLNVYVAPLLLKEPVEARSRHWSNIADPEWAQDYVNNNRKFWTKDAKKLLKAVYQDKAVTEERLHFLSQENSDRDSRLIKGRALKAIKERVLG